MFGTGGTGAAGGFGGFGGFGGAAGAGGAGAGGGGGFGRGGGGGFGKPAGGGFGAGAMLFGAALPSGGQVRRGRRRGPQPGRWQLGHDAGGGGRQAAVMAEAARLTKQGGLWSEGPQLGVVACGCGLAASPRTESAQWLGVAIGPQQRLTESAAGMAHLLGKGWRRGAAAAQRVGRQCGHTTKQRSTQVPRGRLGATIGQRPALAVRTCMRLGAHRRAARLTA